MCWEEWVEWGFRMIGIFLGCIQYSKYICTYIQLLYNFSNGYIVFIPKLNPFLLLSHFMYSAKPFFMLVRYNIVYSVYIPRLFFLYANVYMVCVLCTFFFIVDWIGYILDNQMHLFGLWWNETLFSANLPFFLCTCVFYGCLSCSSVQFIGIFFFYHQLHWLYICTYMWHINKILWVFRVPIVHIIWGKL